MFFGENVFFCETCFFGRNMFFCEKLFFAEIMLFGENFFSSESVFFFLQWKHVFSESMFFCDFFFKKCFFVKTYLLCDETKVSTYTHIAPPRYILLESAFYKKIALPIIFTLHRVSLCSTSGCCVMTVNVQGYFQRKLLFFSIQCPKSTKNNLAR